MGTTNLIFSLLHSHLFSHTSFSSPLSPDPLTNTRRKSLPSRLLCRSLRLRLLLSLTPSLSETDHYPRRQLWPPPSRARRRRVITFATRRITAPAAMEVGTELGSAFGAAVLVLSANTPPPLPRHHCSHSVSPFVRLSTTWHSLRMWVWEHFSHNFL